MHFPNYLLFLQITHEKVLLEIFHCTDMFCKFFLNKFFHIKNWFDFDAWHFAECEIHIAETLKHKDLMVKHLTLRRVPLPWIMIFYQVLSTLPRAQIWKWSHSHPLPLNSTGYNTNKPPLLHKILTRGVAQVGDMVVRQLPASFPDPAGPARHRRRLRHRDNSKP